MKPSLLVVWCCTVNSLLLAQDGQLDVTFDSDGKVVTPVGSYDNVGFSVALQTDGKIVVAGSCYNPTIDFAVVRYNSDGSLDTTFDSDGKVITPVGSSTDYPTSTVLQVDEKIVVGGYSSNGSNFDFAVVRYNSDGSLDTTFDSDGKVTTPIGSSQDYGQQIAIQADGKVVHGGSSWNGSNNDFAVVRYNSNGGLDNTFGSGGKVTTPIGSLDDQANSVAIQTDGKIVVAGFSNNGSFEDFALVRYNSDGSLDNTFGSGGKVTTSFGSSNVRGESMMLQADGKIVVGGGNSDFAVARYNSDGSLDNTFDTDGKVTTTIGTTDYGSSVALQADGKIVVAGYAQGTNFDFAVVRYNSDGSLDTSFDSDGKLTTPIGSGQDYAYSVALQQDGKIVVAGGGYGTADNDLVVVRYTGSSGPLPITLASFSGTVVGANNVLLEWQTITEVNNYGFYVERRAESEEQFSTVSSLIPGAGTTTEPQYYSHIDNSVTQPGLYHYRLRQVDLDGSIHCSPVVDVNLTALSVTEQAPHEFRVFQNYPNPFNPRTAIPFTLRRPASVMLEIYDVLGRSVASLSASNLTAGDHIIRWDASGVPSGVYFCRMRVRTADTPQPEIISQTRKLVLLR